jgi:hypothetical protein
MLNKLGYCSTNHVDLFPHPMLFSNLALLANCRTFAYMECPTLSFSRSQKKEYPHALLEPVSAWVLEWKMLGCILVAAQLKRVSL